MKTILLTIAISLGMMGAAWSGTIVNDVKKYLYETGGDLNALSGQIVKHNGKKCMLIPGAEATKIEEGIRIYKLEITSGKYKGCIGITWNENYRE